MMMSIMSMMAYLSSGALATGRDPIPTGNNHPIASPYGLFQAADGQIAVAPSTEAIVRKFLNEIGIGALLDATRALPTMPDGLKTGPSSTQGSTPRWPMTARQLGSHG